MQVSKASMLNLSNLVLVLVIFVITKTRASLVSLNGQQGYENVLIYISNDVPVTDCAQIVNNLKSTLQEASDYMCKALDQRAYFGNITVIVPNHWSTCQIGIDSSISWPRVHKADVILSVDHPVFGPRPFTLQYGGCGTRSLSTRLPVGFLSSSNRGAALVHEWFHYRYGVFDEIGIKGDNKYPNGYKIYQQGSTMLPNSCTNVPLKGEWSGDVWHTMGDNSAIKSSVMFTTELDSINRTCSKENHLKAAPNKHNWLCDGRSVSEVINGHRDFTTSNNQTMTCGVTRFSVTTNPHRGYHIILDVSSAMAPTASVDLLKSAVFAVSHFVWFLPDNLIVSIDTFSDTHTQLQTPVVLNVTTKNTILAKLEKLVVVSGGTQGLGLALKNAMKVFRLGEEIILITASKSVPSDYATLVDQFRKELIAPHVLALSPSTMTTFSGLARDGYLHFIPNWSTDTIPGSRSLNAQSWMIDTLHSVYSRTRKYHAKEVEITLALNKGWTNGTFQLDSTGSSLVFGFYHLDSGFSTTFKRGVLKGPFGEECVIFLLQSVTLYPADCESITVFEKGTWSYFIESSGSTVVRLDVWYEAATSNLVRVETWTNSFQHNPIDWTKESVIVYAGVFQQVRAISGLNPVAYVTGDNSTEIISVPLTETNPSDITKGDGIYSAILSKLPANSVRFAYVVEVIGGTGTLNKGVYDGHPLAGSSIPNSQPSAGEVTFNRYVYGGSFQLSQAYDGRDASPPGRVSDLSIASFDTSSYIAHLEWTGPNDDFGASALLINKFVVTVEDSLNVGQQATVFDGTIRPSAGTLNRMSVDINATKAEKDRFLYYRVYGVDSATPVGNRGQPSNIATLFVTGVGSPTDDNINKAGLPPLLFWILVGIGCAVGILLLCLAIFLICRRRKANKSRNKGSNWVQVGVQPIPPPGNGETRDIRTEFASPDINPSSNGPSSWRSNDSSFSRHSSDASEIYHRPEVVVAPARLEMQRRDRSDSDESTRNVAQLSASRQSVAFGDSWEKQKQNPLKSILVTPSKMKVPPPPPPRQYYPYGKRIGSTPDVRRQAPSDVMSVTSSQQSVARSYQQENQRSEENQKTPNVYSSQTFDSASISLALSSKFGSILGTDSQVSLV